MAMASTPLQSQPTLRHEPLLSAAQPGFMQNLHRLQPTAEISAGRDETCGYLFRKVSRLVHTCRTLMRHEKKSCWIFAYGPESKDISESRIGAKNR